MNARSTWSARPNPNSADRKDSAGNGEPERSIEELLDARFDQEGRLTHPDESGEQRSAARHEPRAPDLGAEELERAVQKLAHGLEAIERQGRAPAPTRSATEGGRTAGRDFVTYSLDRLEARLEALSKRLQQRAAGEADVSASAPSQMFAAPERERRRSDPSLAVEPADERETERAELRRLAEMERARLEAEEAAAEARRRAEEAETRRRAEAEEALRRAEAEEARRRAEIEAAERRAEAAAARRQAEAVAVQRQFERLEERIDALQQQADENQIEPIRADLLELLQQLQSLGRDGRSIAEAVESAHTRLDDMDARVNAARNMAGNRLGDVHDRVGKIAGRLDRLEIEIPGFDAVRENQGAILERFDRMEGLVERLASADEVLDRVDGVRKQLQAAASQREVARIEEHMLRLAEQIESLPENLSDAAILGRIEQQLHDLAAEALEVRRERSSAISQLDQRFAELGGLVREVGEIARPPDLGALEEKLAEIGERLDDDRRSSGDLLARLERRIAEVASTIETQGRAAASQVIAALASKIDALGEAIDAQDAAGTNSNIEALDRKLDQLAEALAEQAESLSRPQIEPLETRLDIMQSQLEELSRRASDSSAQLGPFTLKLQEISDRVNALGLPGAPTPLSQRLAAIEERIASVAAKGAEPRALQTQLDAILSRLELLKGRSIDPARLTDLFDRVDAAIRAIPEDRFDRIEQRIGETGIPADRLDRIERQIAERDYGPLAEERFNRLERKFAERDIAADLEEHFALLARRLGDPDSGRDSAERLARLEEKLDALARVSLSGPQASGVAALTLDDLADLRSDIAMLRREIRSLPSAGESDSDLGEVLRSISAQLDRFSVEPPLTAADLDARITSIAAASHGPKDAGLALGHIESSLRAIEERLEETRRAASQQDDQERDSTAEELDIVADMARALSEDVSTLKGAAAASERKTKDALDAVQDTLEAVVKRMAFIERDAEAPSSALRPQPETETELPALRVTADAQAEAEAEVEPSDAPQREPSNGLLSRFTSRQLLRRATGGRAESFAPEADEPEDISDLPLEPNTDAPLASDLSGAPSSDTALLSGSRSRAKGLDSRDRNAVLSPYPIDEDIDNEFLLAARRAARAAAAEATAAEEMGPAARAAKVARSIGTRRRAVLAAALAVAIAFAAFQIIRNQIEPGALNIAVPSQTTSRSTSVVDAAKPPVASPPVGRQVASAPAVPKPSTAARSAEDSPAAPAQATSRTASPAAPIPARPTASPPAASTVSAPAATVAARASGEPEAASPSSPTLSSPAMTSAAGPAAVPLQSPESEPEATDLAARDATETARETGTTEPEPAESAVPISPESMSTEQAAVPASIGPERLRNAALAGDPLAAFEVAARFAEGRNVPQDMSAAVEWYERAAAAGIAPAQYRLGSIFEKGLGVPRDLSQAQEWYQQAADAGNVKAMHNLAVLYAEGAGGEPDLEAAAALFRRAAEHGVRDSQFNLAILHARGLGVTQDLIEAYKWFDIAARSGDEESEKRRDIIAAALSSSDLAKAEAASTDFEPVPLIAEMNEVMTPNGGWGEDATSVGVERGTDVSENDLVALVQKLLAEKGYDPGPPDGLLGRQTIEAISAYQRKLGLPVTGQIDDGLVTALRRQAT